MKVSHNHKAILFMLSSTLSLAVTGLVTQFLAAEFEAIELALLRFWLPALFLFVFLIFRGIRFPPKSMQRVLIIRACCIAACQLCFIYALGKLSLIESVVLFGTGPLFIALFEKFLSRIQLAKQTLVALLLTFFGVVFLAGDPQGVTLKPELIIGLMAGVFNAGSQLSLHRASKGEMTGTENNAWTFLFAGMLLVPVAVVYYASVGVLPKATMLTLNSPSDVELVVAVLLLTVMIINTQVCRYHAYQVATTNTQVAPLIYTNLIFTAIFQFALLNASFTSMQLFGIGLIVFGNLLPVVLSSLLSMKSFMSRPPSSSSASN